MNDAFAILLFLGLLVGPIVLAAHLCLLPGWIFLRDQRWLTEKEFREANPKKAWCRHMPAIAIVSGFLLHVSFFLTVRATCSNTVALMVAFLPLAFLWIYVPVGFVELLAGVSVLVPIGRRRRADSEFIVAPAAVRAGAFRLCITALVFAAFLIAAYW